MIIIKESNSCDKLWIARVMGFSVEEARCPLCKVYLVVTLTPLFDLQEPVSLGYWSWELQNLYPAQKACSSVHGIWHTSEVTTSS